MAKTPRSGGVKTRITSFAPAQVAELYRCFLVDTLQLASQVDEAEPVVAYTPPEAEEEMLSLLPPGFALVPQEGANLNQRMENAFRHHFQSGYGAVVMIGSDSPHLPATYIAQAFRELENPQVNVVLGPCEDGGYYLVGLKSLYPQLFRDVTMSTSRVLQETLERVREANLAVVLLPIWYDVDTLEDVRRLRTSLLNDNSQVAQHTRRFLLKVWPP